MSRLPPISGGSSSSSTSALYSTNAKLNAAMARMATAIGFPTTWRTPVDHSWGRGYTSGTHWTPSGTGTVSAPTAGVSGGWAKLATGAAGSSSIILRPPANTQFDMVTHPKNKRWMLAHEMLLVTAYDANAHSAVGLYDSSVANTLLSGFVGPGSTATYRVQYDGNYTGTYLDLGVSVDTSTAHVFVMAGDGTGKIYGLCDSGTIVSATMAAGATTQHNMFCVLGNGATAADRQSQFAHWTLVTE